MTIPLKTKISLCTPEVRIILRIFSFFFRDLMFLEPINDSCLVSLIVCDSYPTYIKVRGGFDLSLHSYRSKQLTSSREIADRRLRKWEDPEKHIALIPFHFSPGLFSLMVPSHHWVFLRWSVAISVPLYLYTEMKGNVPFFGSPAELGLLLLFLSFVLFTCCFFFALKDASFTSGKITICSSRILDISRSWRSEWKIFKDLR